MTDKWQIPKLATPAMLAHTKSEPLLQRNSSDVKSMFKRCRQALAKQVHFGSRLYQDAGVSQ